MVQAGARRPAEAGQVFRDIVVVGASAGGVEALDRLVAGLPPELPAAIFVVLHVPATGNSVLPQILARAGKLPASVPEDCQRPERGHIYVAPADRHMLLMGKRVRLSGGPRENGHRPAVDPLFRSAARAHGPRVIAIVLSGNLDDGAAGARLVKQSGGTVLAQDPADALYPDMPAHTAAVTGVDGILSADAMPERIGRLLEEPVADRDDESVEEREEREEREDDELAAAELALAGTPSELSCPECGGQLWERDEGPLVRFACRVGHVFSPESLIAEHGKELERALWSAMRGLEERADLYRRMARRARSGSSVRERFQERAAGAEQHAIAVREAMARLTGNAGLEGVK